MTLARQNLDLIKPLSLTQPGCATTLPTPKTVSWSSVHTRLRKVIYIQVRCLGVFSLKGAPKDKKEETPNFKIFYPKKSNPSSQSGRSKMVSLMRNERKYSYATFRMRKNKWLHRQRMFFKVGVFFSFLPYNSSSLSSSQTWYLLYKLAHCFHINANTTFP